MQLLVNETHQVMLKSMTVITSGFYVTLKMEGQADSIALWEILC